MAISRFSIRHQLLLLGALIIASVWTGAFLQYLQLRAQAERTAEVRADLGVAKRLDELADALARERGQSNGRLAARDAAVSAELLAARIQVDRAFEGLTEAWMRRRSGERLPQEVASRVAGLDDMRRRIDERQVVGSEAFGYFSGVVGAAQDSAASSLAVGMVQIGLPYEHVNHVHRAVELLSQLRGLTFGLLKSGVLDHADRDRLAHVIVAYEESLHLYERAVDAPTRARFAETLYEPALLGTVERVRDLSRLADLRAFDLEPAAWWALATRAIEALDAVAGEQASDLARAADARIDQIERQLAWTVAALVLLGLVTLVMVVSTVGRIVRGLDRLLIGLDNVGRHRKFDERIADSGHDEFGTISDGINKLIAIAGSVVQEQEVLSLTDALTGATNRRGFDQQLAARTTQARMHSLPLALVMVDIDHFKSINDTLGHPAGDQVLRQMGRVLHAQLRADDVLARFGGEEFAVLLPGCEMAAAREVAEKLRRAIEAHDFGIDRRVTASLGVATWDHDRSAHDLLAEADAQLYASKQGGRNRVMPAAVLRAEPAMTA